MPRSPLMNPILNLPCALAFAMLRTHWISLMRPTKNSVGTGCPGLNGLNSGFTAFILWRFVLRCLAAFFAGFFALFCMWFFAQCVRVVWFVLFGNDSHNFFRAFAVEFRGSLVEFVECLIDNFVPTGAFCVFLD